MPPKRPTILNPLQRGCALVSLEGNTNVELALGPQVLGRDILAPGDKRVSRSHCSFKVKQEEQVFEVFISRVGRNLVIVNSQGTSKSLSEGEIYQLQNDDIISLINLYSYKVSIPVPSNGAPPKREREEEEEDTVDCSDDENFIIQRKPKKPKTEHKEPLHTSQTEADLALPLALQAQEKLSTHKNSQKPKNNDQEEADLRLALSLQPKECSLCLEEIDIDFMHTLSCTHEFCRDCLIKCFETAIDSKDFPIVCPSQNCKKEVPEPDLKLLLDNVALHKYQEGTLSSFVERNADQFSCCPTPDCTYLFFYKPGDFDFRCPQCKKRYCLNCKVEYHKEVSCKEYQKWCLENGMGDDLFRDFISGTKCKQCPGCKKWVEKNQGCDHITCRCGYEFCYKCGGKYPKCLCKQMKKKKKKKKTSKKY